jgi:hypothetical protein
MNVKVQVKGEQEVKDLLKKFEKATGKGIETGIKEMALSTARALATKMQPYGVGGGGKAKKFQENIEKQIVQVFIGVNLGQYGETSNLESAHRSVRRRGRVKGEKMTKEGGRRWKGIIDEDQKKRLIEDKQAKAGRAKAAWITAGNSLGVGKISRIGRWIDRHVGKGYGASYVTGRNLRAKVELENRTPYLSYLQKERDIRAALKEGREKGILRLRIITKKVLGKYA